MPRLRIIGFVAASLCALHLCAQRCEHVVQRGEDFSSIAQKYGITVDELKASNPSSSSCYVGRKLLIPNPGEVVKRKPVKVEPFDYGLVSSLGDSILTKSTVTTYQVGEALWKKKKYSEAMAYLSSAAYGGETRAYYPLADCYSQPLLADHDDETAVSWYMKAVADVKEKSTIGYIMPCLRLSRCYLDGTGIGKDIKQARLLYNEYSRHAVQPYPAEARQLQRDITAAEAAVAKAERDKRMAEQQKAREEKRRKEAERAKAAANKRTVATNGTAGSSNSTGSSNRVTAGNSSATPRRSVQSRPASTAQASSNYVVQTWREELGYGCFVIVEKWANGCVSRVRYRQCPNCRTSCICDGCSGTGRCGICKGQGGIITSGYGRYIPCGLCQSSGVCNLCKGSGRCMCTNPKNSKYPGYVIGSTSLITPDGTTIRNSGGYNGRDDKFTITPPGGTTTTYDDNSSSGSSSSRRRSSGSCSKCGGTGFDSSGVQYAAASAHGVRPPYHSKLGDRCPYCSSVADHYHVPCARCLGKGRE